METARNYLIVIVPMALILSAMGACSFLKQGWNELNIFPLEQDVELGRQVYEEILSKPEEFPLVPEQGNEELYSYVRGIAKRILQTGQVSYAKNFAWKVTLINDPKMQNAFCTPGGYIFVYTGILKFLDSEDQFAGVMGHEIAHAANRHSTKQLSKMLGVQILIDAATGNREALKSVVTILATIGALQFSREHEVQADSFSVKYLCATEYNAAGAAGFFKKIVGQPTPPQWLSTHPNPGNRINNIEGKKRELNCQGGETYRTRFDAIKPLIDKIPPPKLNPPTNPNVPANRQTQKSDGSIEKNAPTGTDKGQGDTKLKKPKS